MVKKHEILTPNQLENYADVISTNIYTNNFITGTGI